MYFVDRVFPQSSGELPKRGALEVPRNGGERRQAIMGLVAGAGAGLVVGLWSYFLGV